MRRAATAFALILALGAAFAWAHRGEIRRARFVVSMFQGGDLSEAFGDMGALFPAHEMATARPSPLPAGTPRALPERYVFRGEPRDTEALLAETDTKGLLVMKDGHIVHERYAPGYGPASRWISWSVAKSFVSALVGIALEEGLIASVEEPVSARLPELAGSAYEGVSVRDVLQMSSGARWNEDYSDPFSDINRFGRRMALGGSMNALAATLQREREPGTYNRYNSMDTQVLGMLLVRATGRSLAEYMEEKLWQPLHMEHDAYWIVDDTGMEMAFGGLNATLRDYARFGELYRRGGAWDGRAVVPRAWVDASTRADAPHLEPGENPLSDWVVGYGYQWWLPEDDEGAFCAIGVYNQFVYVSPRRGVVVAKISANHGYGGGEGEASDRELETLALFRTIAAGL